MGCDAGSDGRGLYLVTDHFRISSIAALLAVSIAGCVIAGDCAGVGRPMVSATVLDAESRVPVARGATLYVFRSGSSTVFDSIAGARDDFPLEPRREETGVFDLLIEKAGYFPWTLARVRV